MKIKTITKKWLQTQGACGSAVEAWGNEKTHGTIVTLDRLIKRKQYDWANWLIVRVMARKQYLRYAIYAAERVIEIYEKQYPNDKRPREAIQAAKQCLKNDTAKNRSAAESAESAARSAESAESAARSAESAARSAARSAAWSAESAARSAARSAAWSARSAARSAWSAAEAAMQLKILRYGMKILKEDN